MNRHAGRRVLAAVFAAGLTFGAAACDTEESDTTEDDTTELEDRSEDREQEVDEGVNQGQTDEDQGD